MASWMQTRTVSSPETPRGPLHPHDDEEEKSGISPKPSMGQREVYDQSTRRRQAFSQTLRAYVMFIITDKARASVGGM